MFKILIIACFLFAVIILDMLKNVLAERSHGADNIKKYSYTR